ncbi:hypothetical protein TCAL_03164 [Tigriopus californicus]|uniref:Cas1p 10 TM acyl transferase domain-containing protein n=1 Tax=Tigriopus californicus TaxID=6832 RepID=A0A553N7S5_TIGCA|nr:N-acetylneuraminate 9-O-acetyltransferase-like [Tigriopus californicus]XP_059088527.1 N-acetylneuraminate 9-O-acetyltransferase-like [Tigriopus californicus]TRY61460.1 hypothetical protein TCAL_03164 [Tigriopus californicus]|eukprot:TCALIF_03164-PA protein Name:"Similar to Casd1 CAS1 domain-containing protein 1 (Mus musculus)" AED:0.12 eAED:0.12 QI:76/1/1/1/0.61/0.64/14/58/718
MRQIFHSLRRLSASALDPQDIAEEYPAHFNLHWKSNEQNLKLDFFWLPEYKRSMESLLDQLMLKPPSIVVLGIAVHSIKSSNNSVETLLAYRKNLTRLAQKLNSYGSVPSTHFLWMMQPPVNHAQLERSRQMITNAAISQYNDVAMEVFKDSSIVTTWESVPSLVEEFINDLTDGIHMPVPALKQASLMLLNLHCNEKMNFQDGSCCKKSDSPTSLQMFSFGLVYLCAFLLIFTLVYQRFCQYNSYHVVPVEDGPGPTSALLSLYEVLVAPSNPTNGSMAGAAAQGSDMGTFLWAMTKLAIILSYFYVCDRTNFFMKENKYFTPLSFWLPLLYVVVLGIFFNEESKGTRFLHREQTDEWKGWMQLVILIYHFTGASSSLPIYLHIRVLVASYIFLNGYGNFFYVWRNGKLGMERLLQVLFRMNFLTLMLCVGMNRPYQEYYFVPLISFWFSLQYLILAIPPKITSQSCESHPMHYFYFILKVLAMLGIISILYISEVFFEKIFLTRPWKALFVSMDDDIREWWFRWRLDRYSMVCGTVFAFMVALGHRYKLLDESPNGRLFPGVISVILTLASGSALIAFLVFALYCRGKEYCNNIHSYISAVPIVSFILLRNVFGRIRCRYSTFFAWFGRISLELFIAQYHIWLAADTHGVLVLIPNYPVVNLILTSFIFICAAHEVHVITSTLLPYVVPSDSKLILRNLVIFLFLMIPIGIRDGML